MTALYYKTNRVPTIIALCLLLLLSLYTQLSVADEALLVVVKKNFINMHTGPGRGYPIFYIAEKNEAIWLLKTKTNWVKVRNLKDKEGWISIKDIDFTQDKQGNWLSMNKPSLNGYQGRQWEVGFMAGTFGDTDEITAFAAYQLTENIGAEISASQSFGSFSDSNSYSIHIVQEPFPSWRYSPYFFLGAGQRTTSPRSTLVSTEDRTNDVAIVGLGMKMYLANRLVLRLQYKSNTVLTSRDDDEIVDEWKIGLSAYF